MRQGRTIFELAKARGISDEAILGLPARARIGSMRELPVMLALSLEAK